MKQKTPFEHNIFFSIENKANKSAIGYATISISKNLVNAFFHETAQTLQGTVQAYGFQPGTVPLEYISKQYRMNIIEHLKEFFFKFGIINFLFQEIRTQKILVAGEPRLIEIFLDYDNNARFVFELSLFESLELLEWKYFSFKAPNRKNYKDLDRQVDGFIQEEKSKGDLLVADKLITIGDWVNFDIAVVTNNNELLHDNFHQNFWLRLGDEEVESPLRGVFIGRSKGEEFVISNKGLQDYFSDQLRTFYSFRIKVLDIVPYEYFCFDQFKDHFKIKTNKDMHKKLIEVFSYRNDMSQRLAMVEDALKLLLAKHKFFPPDYLVLRQKKIILSAIQKNPDYNVYRKQRDFNSWIQQLAEKQVKETLLLDQLIYDENILVEHEDIVNFLNLHKRPRMKNFVYFNLPDSKSDGQEMPWPSNEISRFCAREKAINYVIHHLTKR